MFQLKYLIIDFHVLHFRIFKVLQVGFFFKSFYKHNILGFFFSVLDWLFWAFCIFIHVQQYPILHKKTCL